MHSFERTVIFLSFLLPLSSCSVKEDRMQCPCTLCMGIVGGEESKVNVSLWGSSLVFEDSRELDSASCWTAEVPKGDFVCTAMSGVHGMSRSGSCLVCVEGEEMGQVYAGNQVVKLIESEYTGKISLKRQFAFVNIRLVSSERGEYPFSVVVQGEYDGFDLLSLKPHKGIFSKPIFPVLGAWHRVCVPRQDDDSLKLLFYLSSDSEAESRPRAELPLGEYIKSSGYDWYSEDLKDVNIEIDYAEANLTVSLSDWTTIVLLQDL